MGVGIPAQRRRQPRNAAIFPTIRASVGVAEGVGRLLRGRSLNRAYRVHRAGQEFLVKVHRPGRYDEHIVRRLTAVDALLRGRPWYPPVLDIGWRTTAAGTELVVIRPYLDGATLRTTGDTAALVWALGEIAEHGEGTNVDAELVADYASAWLAEPEAAAERVATADPALVGHVVPHLEALFAAAGRSTTTARRVQHGDLHEYNLVRRPDRALSVIDWDDAGFSNRPADCARALWFAGREQRGGFKLDPRALERFVRAARRFEPVDSAVDFAQLGAMSFLPWPAYVDGLRRHDPAMAEWYTHWSRRYWSAFEANLGVVTSVAASL